MTGRVQKEQVQKPFEELPSHRCGSLRFCSPVAASREGRPLWCAVSSLQKRQQPSWSGCFAKVFGPQRKSCENVRKTCSMSAALRFPTPSLLISHNFIRVCCPGEQSAVQPSQEVDGKDHPGWDTQGRSRWGWTTACVEYALQKGRASEWEPQSKRCLRNRSPEAQPSPHCPIITLWQHPRWPRDVWVPCDLGKGRLSQLKMKTIFLSSLHTCLKGFGLSRLLTI